MAALDARAWLLLSRAQGGSFPSLTHTKKSLRYSPPRSYEIRRVVCAIRRGCVKGASLAKQRIHAAQHTRLGGGIGCEERGEVGMVGLCVCFKAHMREATSADDFDVSVPAEGTYNLGEDFKCV